MPIYNNYISCRYMYIYKFWSDAQSFSFCSGKNLRMKHIFFSSFFAKLFCNLNFSFNLFFVTFCLVYLYKLHRTAFSCVYFVFCFWFSFLLLLDDIDLFMFFLFLFCFVSLLLSFDFQLSKVQGCCSCGCCCSLAVVVVVCVEYLASIGLVFGCNFYLLHRRERSIYV